MRGARFWSRKKSFFGEVNPLAFNWAGGLFFMFAHIASIGLLGLEAFPVRVEVDVSPGLPAFDIVGLPDAAVRESRERVRAAIRNSGLEFPLKRVTVNLAPADLRKEGPAFDLPIAVGILAATGQIPVDATTKWHWVGELSLDGKVKGIAGVLAMVWALRDGVAGWETQVTNSEEPFFYLAVPEENLAEARLIPGLMLWPVDSLQSIVEALQQEKVVLVKSTGFGEDTGYQGLGCGCYIGNLQGDNNESLSSREVDLADIKGLGLAKRALEIAAAGGHHLLLVGPPGAGKTMLSRCLPTILPPMTLEECLEVTRIYSAAGMLPRGRYLITERPFRTPHHTSSTAALVGGGRIPKPGEISLAHCGVLYLDEMLEFSREALEALRQPLEDGVITVARLGATFTFPSRISLVGSANPCPCGFLGDRQRQCTCTPRQIQRYRQKLSGPLLDRFDLQVEVSRLSWGELDSPGGGEPSAAVRRRVEEARKIQASRLKERGIFCNGAMGRKEIEVFCKLSSGGKALLRSSFKQLGLSARAYDRVLRVARTIADLDSSPAIKEVHLAEALQYRAWERQILDW